MLVFKGIQKTTLIDFPGRVACTLFLPKCNFKCPFCYNRQLVFDEKTGIEISEKEALSFLKERKNFLDGTCITGGEPLLHPEIEGFCRKVKELGLLVKIDTNGSMPKLLKKLLEEKLVDYIAMDIKASPKKYSLAAGTKVDLDAIKESIGLIMDSGIDYELRMTAVPCLHSKEDFEEIGKWLKGAKRFFLQQFSPSMPLLDPKLEKTRPFSREEMLSFAGIMKPFFKEVAVRGI